MRWLPAILVVLPAATAHAQPPGESVPRRQADPPHRSPALALGLSLGVTAAGTAIAIGAASRHDADITPVLAGGLIAWVGPATGRWAGGGSAALGLFARGVAGIVILAGASERPNDDCVEDMPGDCDAEDAASAAQKRRARRIIGAGAAVWIASSVYDIVRAPLDARDFNRAHAITVAPAPMSAGPGAPLVPGLVVGGRF